MRSGIGLMRGLLRRVGGIKYVLRDQFITDRAAGAIHGTACEPGPGTRTVTDTESKLTIASGQLVCAGGQLVPADGDPGYWLPAVTRAAGRIAKFHINLTSNVATFGWDTAASGIISANGGRFASTGLFSLDSGSVGPAIYTIANPGDYQYALILRATGNHFFIYDGSQWLLLWSNAINNTASLLPGICGRTAAFASNYLRVPYTLWLPSPVFSDGMSTSAASDGLGHAETTGIGSGGGGIVTDYTVSGGVANIVPTLGETNYCVDPGFDSPASWTPGTGWTVADGIATKTAGVGAQLLQVTSPPASIGTWYYLSGDVVRTAGTVQFYIGGTAGDINTSGTPTIRTVRATSTARQSIYAGATFAGTVDNLSGYALTLSTLINGPTQEFGSENVTVDIALAALTTGTQSGLALRVDSLTTPANFVLIYLDGTNVKVDECVAGTYTNKLSVAQTFTANGVLRVRIHDSTVWVWYASNGTTFAAISGSPATLASPTTNKYHRVFSTYSGNTFDNLIIRPLGTNNEYAVLERL